MRIAVIVIIKIMFCVLVVTYDGKRIMCVCVCRTMHQLFSLDCTIAMDALTQCKARNDNIYLGCIQFCKRPACMIIANAKHHHK